MNNGRNFIWWWHLTVKKKTTTCSLQSCFTVYTYEKRFIAQIAFFNAHGTYLLHCTAWHFVSNQWTRGFACLLNFLNLTNFGFHMLSLRQRNPDEKSRIKLISEEILLITTDIIVGRINGSISIKCLLTGGPIRQNHFHLVEYRQLGVWNAPYQKVCGVFNRLSDANV